ncbi:MAG TPA: macro domain-containing protein [bacterium]|nr:macro domain-containing protein [bacterium]
MEKVFLKDKVIKLVEGDITEQHADAVVNAANSALWMGAGVAGAIKRRGGREIEDEAVAKGPIPIGEAVATGAGRLPARYVIHAAGMGPNLATDANKIRSSTLNSLVRADELRLESIAFPSIGTGVGGFPMRECAEIMLGEAKRFLTERKTSLKEVRFVLWSKGAFQVFDDVLKGIE